MDTAALGTDPDRRQLNELASMFDAPAYIRRARRVHDELGELLLRCRQKREEDLPIPRLRLGTLHARAGDYPALRPWLAGPEEVGVLETLHGLLRPHLRLPVEPTRSGRLLEQALGQLVESLTRFNTRWRAAVEKLDLRPINALREEYNRYYVIEKSCALGSDLLARQGFEPMVPLSVKEVLSHLPLLQVPRLAR